MSMAWLGDIFSFELGGKPVVGMCTVYLIVSELLR